MRLAAETINYRVVIPSILLIVGSWFSFDVMANVTTELPVSTAPNWQSAEQAAAKSAGCQSCHISTDSQTMHDSQSVTLGCTDCHGGQAEVSWTGPLPDKTQSPDYSEKFLQVLRKAHVLPRYPQAWNWPSSANPKHSYALLNRESPEFVRFVNPSDYRVAREACGACHLPIIEAAERSLMSTGAMFWGGAAYNNGVLPFKNYVLGEAYDRNGNAAGLTAPVPPDANMKAKRILPEIWPLPPWEVVPAVDNFRVFEDGGRRHGSLFPELGLPESSGDIQRLNEPGRPDLQASNRAPGTGNRVSGAVLNIHKTRLNDPFSWFLGTNDQPGDYRSSGCAACHVVYANDREPRHAGPYAIHGRDGKTQTSDPLISKQESGHPLNHRFTRAIPTSQCMVCHMHQPNIFVNSFLGYTMWDYESDAPRMWPKKQRYPDDDEIRKINRRNPEGAASRGRWGDPEFLREVWDKNDQMQHTQFADYHGHGWNFRAIFKKNRQGDLLDEQGHVVPHDDPEKFDKAVHMMSIHAEKGMHCVDCHFSQDAHGSGHIVGEVAAAIEIDCVDCHGTADRYPSLKTSGPAAPPGGHDLADLRVADGRRRFLWRDGQLIQRSALHADKEWQVSLVKDSVNPSQMNYNAKAARAKLMSSDTSEQDWGLHLAYSDRAHNNEDMVCQTCHTSWTTSCAGCHLPTQANWQSERQRYEGGMARGYSTYNPQVVRDQMFMLGKHGPSKGNRIAPIRSSSALVLSAQNANREQIYIQQPPISAPGFSSQAFAPHFAHTVRKTETKTCDDCHLSADNDNNAIMAQLLLQGTNFVNFVGQYAWLGLEQGVTGIKVTEWEEPQAVLGSWLHRYAYPDDFSEHTKNRQQLTIAEVAGSARVNCLQMRGEYLYAAEGSRGVRVYDIAAIANKGVSQKIVGSSLSPLGAERHLNMPNASCLALPTNQPIHPDRNQGDLMRLENQEQAFHPIYRYLVAVDAEQGLVLSDINTLADADPSNNYLNSAIRWNPEHILDGARHVSLAGQLAFVTTPNAIQVLDLDQPLQPRWLQSIPLADARATAVQFRYLFATSAAGFSVIDMTQPRQARIVATVPISDARKLYLARTYAYVAAGSEGLVIVDIERPEQPNIIQRFNAAGAMNDAWDVIVASTNASLFAYVADGKNGLKVLQLTSPESQPGFYGFSPKPIPQLIASMPSATPARALSKGLDRDRAADEQGNQIAIFGRIGSRPMRRSEMETLYLDDSGHPWFVQPSSIGE